MEDCQNLFKESKATLGIMIISVLFITGASSLSLMVLGEWFGWLPIPVYFIVPLIIFISLSILVVKYGFKYHSTTDGEKLKSILMIAGIILLSIPSAYIINQYIWKAGVIDGKYPISKFEATAIELQNLATLHVSCLSVSFLVFLGIAVTTWLRREKLVSLKGLLTVNVILLLVSLWTIQIVDSHDGSWYYGNEKVLHNKIEKYYAQITQLDSICNDYNIKVTDLYNELLIAELKDFHRGNQNPLPENAPLKDRHKRYDEMKSWLFDCVYMHNQYAGAIKKIYDECSESEEELNKRIHTTLDIQKIRIIQNSIDKIERELRNTDFEKMNNGYVYREQVDTITSIAREINSIGSSFIKYMTPEAPMPVYHDIDKITYEATDRLQLVDRRLNSYNEKFRNK